MLNNNYVKLPLITNEDIEKSMLKIMDSTQNNNKKTVKIDKTFHFPSANYTGYTLRESYCDYFQLHQR